MVYDESPFDRKDSLPVQIRNAEEVIRPEDRMGRLMHILLLIAIVVMVVLFYGQFVIQKEIPLFTEIMQYKWNKGLNIFALTYNIAIIEWTALSVFVLRRILRRIGQMSNAHGETITRLLRSAIRYISVIIVCYVILLNFGIDPDALASSAGLIGIAIGIGARDLITDIVAGIFIIFERDYEVGDLVSVNDYTGRVHEIGMRITKLTGLDGSEKIINNRNMTNVVNESMHPDAISVKFRVPYETDIAWLKKIVEEAAVTWKEKYPEIEKGPVFSGIAKFEDDMVLCGVWLTSTDSSPAVMTAKINFELKKLMDETGIPMKRELAIREKTEQK
jgi:small conductance mechanosensitive channel